MDLLHGPIASPGTGVHMRANRFNGYNDYGVENEKDHSTLVM